MRAGGLLEPAGDVLEHRVAGEMAVAVVDRLEVVQVDEHERHGLVARVDGEGRREQIVEAPSGERPRPASTPPRGGRGREMIASGSSCGVPATWPARTSRCASFETIAR